MLLDFTDVVRKYNMQIKGVIQIGAHWAEEYPQYKNLGIKKMIFIEPCKDAFEEMSRRVKDDDATLIQCGCGEEEGIFQMYTEHTNQGQSNSLLQPKDHLAQHSDVIFNSYEMINVRKLDNIEFDRSLYNMLNIDVQGFEDRVLRGATETLKHIDYLYTEVNRSEMYSTCALVDQLDALLSDFKRVETGWASENLGWGDAVFVRSSLL